MAVDPDRITVNAAHREGRNFLQSGSQRSASSGKTAVERIDLFPIISDENSNLCYLKFDNLYGTFNKTSKLFSEFQMGRIGLVSFS